ncbi:MAG TPA: transglutaminase-like domain-containing protein [Candidatus Nanoarchaeia archaeon]|nr:transglutaminase-like domain-containing protein [Candidatus Nanoarchaeia archaeon]
MKRLLIILIFILVIHSVGAEDIEAEAVESYLNYGNVDAIVKVSSTIDVSADGSSPLLDEMVTRLIFKPFDTEQQSVRDLGVESSKDPKINDEEEEVVYAWSNAGLGTLEFGYNAKVKVNNKFPIIINKIKFPIQSLDSSLVKYIQPGEKIVITDAISRKASEIVAGDYDLFSVVYKLAKWSNENIEYDLNTLTEKAVQDSQWVLDHRQGVCDELTNLFISMARSLGIPARFISGMVYTNTLYDWGAHGWAEVYFPGVGWVPYDPTFGQYGYIDPGHIKMKNSFDSSEPAIKYNWVSRDIGIEVGELDIDVALLSTGGVFTSPIDLDIKVLKNKVGFGSYTPLRATVKNNNNYYVAATIYITKAPGVKGGNKRSVSLEPNSEKDVYFILKTPIGDEQYVYTSQIEVKDSFGRSSSDILEYASNYEAHTLEQAESIAGRLDESDSLTSLILLECNSDKEEYYEYETGEFNCVIKNSGENKLEDLDVCLNKDCQVLSLNANEKAELNFVRANVTQDLFIVAKNKDVVRYSYPEFNFLKLPKVEIKDIEVSQPLSYDEIGNISFLIRPDSPVYNVKVMVGEDLGGLEIKEFDIGQSILIPFYAFKLKTGSNDVNIKITYEDKNGRAYSAEGSVNINVESVNLFKTFVIFFRKVVSKI